MRARALQRIAYLAVAGYGFVILATVALQAR